MNDDTIRYWYTDQVFPLDGAEIEVKDPAYPDSGRLFGIAIGDSVDGALGVTLDDEQPTFDDGRLPEDGPKDLVFYWDKGRGEWLNENSKDVIQRIVWRYVVQGPWDTRHTCCAPIAFEVREEGGLIKLHPKDLHDYPWDCACGERYATAALAHGCKKCFKYLGPEAYRKRVARNVLTGVTAGEVYTVREASENVATFETFEEARSAAAARVFGHPAWVVVPYGKQTKPGPWQHGCLWAVKLDPTNQEHWMLREEVTP